ncbi:transmembrane protein, putative (macronuclear) [Tetrahymena thermophila SB210]|uniref:Transmembrane protein, putative n=1 Tax=Tetrahymena thermophila (strain SB210) TaxID=312017 RepID=W7XJ63_TETTS|nr:transmembrane protein, putative [Tetrahymena thermophila SB210]EWS73889.1 transmembrane protein, putative [Tetrahymena thermophila SB210]|eukprot:XP_012653573.1 transmembrane protein, putative [Tetrahymena thermophila SB210]
MIYSKLDFFSSPFSFNTGNQQTKRGTLFGTALSFFIFVITLSYFVYIIKQYVNNQIEPTFRSQSFINNDLISVPLSSDFVGFRFENGNNQSTQSPDKIYLVYLAFFFYSSPNDNQYIPLKVIDCTNSNLKGFKCLDFTNVYNYTFSLNTNQNIKSSVQILTYGCRDIDTLKTFVPNNCAEQDEIDSMINGINSVLRFKLYTSQYNTTSQRIEERYRNAQIFTIASQSIVTQLKTQNQNTSIKQGLIVQTESNFNSPIQYSQQDLGYDRQYALIQVGGGAYSVALIYIDEIVQQIQIQYPTLPQVFALVNGIFSLLMFTGIFARMVSQNSIRKDLFLLFLKNIYQDSYLQIIKNTKNFQQADEEVVESKIDEQDVQEQKECDLESKSDKEKFCDQPIIIPTFKNKQKTLLEQDQYNNSISNNIENIILNAQNNNQKINNQSNEQINNFMSQGAQNNLNIKQNFITETESIIQSVIGVEQKSFQRDFLSNNSPQNTSLMKFVLNKQSNFQQYQMKEKNSTLSQSSQVLIQNFNAIKTTKCTYKIKEDIPQKNFQKSGQKEGGISKLQLQKVEYQIKKDLNILNFIQDIILLKKAVMMLLTKDQLAAMHLIGCSQSFLELNLSSKNCNLNQLEYRNKLSHYEMQFAISQSKQFQEQYLSEFLQRCTNVENTSELDQRIVQTIQKYNLNVIKNSSETGFEPEKTKKQEKSVYSKIQLDLFSSQFQFGIGSKQKKKGTLFGTILSLVVVITTFSYFVYILKLYVNNEIDPNFKTQSFITEGQIDIGMDNNYVGFQFKYGIQPNQNQTYFQYYAFYYLQDHDNYTMIPLNIIDCASPSLTGFLCLDFSNITNHLLSLNTKGNSGSQLYIFTYRCIDTDQVKTTVPDNCASEADINNMIDNINSGIEFKLFTSQYNTTSQQIQVNYRNAFINPLSSQQVLTYLKSQKQITSIQQGAFIQQSTSFSSNGIFSLLMLTGIFGRMASQNSIRKDLFLLSLKNIYQDSYLQIIKNTKNFQQIEEKVELDIDEQDLQEQKQCYQDSKSDKEKKLIGVCLVQQKNFQRDFLTLSEAEKQHNSRVAKF